MQRYQLEQGEYFSYMHPNDNGEYVRYEDVRAWADGMQKTLDVLWDELQRRGVIDPNPPT